MSLACENREVFNSDNYEAQILVLFTKLHTKNITIAEISNLTESIEDALKERAHECTLIVQGAISYYKYEPVLPDWLTECTIYFTIEVDCKGEYIMLQDINAEL